MYTDIKHTHTHAYIYTYIKTYIHTYIYIYTCIKHIAKSHIHKRGLLMHTKRELVYI